VHGLIGRTGSERVSGLLLNIKKLKIMEQLKLDNQICFPFYAISRLIIRSYQPHLDRLGITYPQYLALLVLWEHDEVSVQFITDKLILNTNTVTPLLKRLEKSGLITRTRAKDDERKVIVSLTVKGKELKSEAALIPKKLIETMSMDLGELVGMRNKIQEWIGCSSAAK
jgi:MarR family transcriptional regulator, organic hydroperoxide resistance regulator